MALANNGAPAAQDPAAPAAQDPAAPAAQDPAAPAAQDPAAAPAAQDPAEPELASLEGLTLGEGFTLAEEDFSQISTIFKDANIPFTKDVAQKLVDLEQQRMGRFAEQQQTAFKEQVSAWEQAVRADKEIGGDKFDENLVIAEQALAKLGSPALTEMLEQTGLGSHPEIVRLFVKLGPLVREDNPVPGTPTGGKEPDLLSRLYGTAK